MCILHRLLRKEGGGWEKRKTGGKDYERRQKTVDRQKIKTMKRERQTDRQEIRL